MKLTKQLVVLLAAIALASPLGAQCTLQLSEEGVVRIQSGEERILTWEPVAGASSYMVNETIDGINEPSGPDFMFGGAYTESRNFEGRGITQFHVSHGVTYKIRYRYTVTALARENPAWQPCSDEVLFVIEPDPELAAIASLRIVPLAGKVQQGQNGIGYSTALVLAGTGMGPSRQDPPPPPRPDGSTNPPYDEIPKLYQGRVYFRPLGTAASDSDPFIEYALGGEETLVINDIMQSLGATGIGTLEVRPKTGYPTPLADAIIERRTGNALASVSGKGALVSDARESVRVPGVPARHALRWADSATVGIRNESDTRLALGVRALGMFGGRVYFQRFSADGHLLGDAERYVDGNTTVLWTLADLFATPLAPGDRIVASYGGHAPIFDDGTRVRTANGPIFFLTESGNDLANPITVTREPLRDPHYLDGFDQFVVY